MMQGKTTTKSKTIEEKEKNEFQNSRGGKTFADADFFSSLMHSSLSDLMGFSDERLMTRHFAVGNFVHASNMVFRGRKETFNLSDPNFTFDL
jgi:hypothetical protein